MEKLDLVQALGNATCMRSFFDTHACTMAESWNFGALLLIGAVVTLAVLALRDRSRRHRENNYYR